MAVAGPVKANSCQVFCFELILFATHVRFQMTNLTWKIDGASLEETFDIKSVRVMNDFEAIGYGIHELEESDLLRLNNCSKSILHLFYNFKLMSSSKSDRTNSSDRTWNRPRSKFHLLFVK